MYWCLYAGPERGNDMKLNFFPAKHKVNTYCEPKFHWKLSNLSKPSTFSLSYIPNIQIYTPLLTLPIPLSHPSNNAPIGWKVGGGGCLQNYRYISIPKWYQHKGINFAQSNCNLCSFTPVQSKIACNFDVQMKINNWAFTIDAASTSLIVYVSLGFASGNIKDLGITNYCFPGFEPSK